MVWEQQGGWPVTDRGHFVTRCYGECWLDGRPAGVQLLFHGWKSFKKGMPATERRRPKPKCNLTFVIFSDDSIVSFWGWGCNSQHYRVTQATLLSIQIIVCTMYCQCLLCQYKCPRSFINSTEMKQCSWGSHAVKYSLKRIDKLKCILASVDDKNEWQTRVIAKASTWCALSRFECSWIVKIKARIKRLSWSECVPLLLLCCMPRWGFLLPQFQARWFDLLGRWRRWRDGHDKWLVWWLVYEDGRARGLPLWVCLHHTDSQQAWTWRYGKWRALWTKCFQRVDFRFLVLIIECPREDSCVHCCS